MQRAVCVLVLVLAACGGKSHDERTNTSSGGNGAFAGVGGANGGVSGGTAGDGAGTAGGAGRLIPKRLCNLGGYCIEGDECTCRDDPRPECQATMACVGQRWALTLGTCTEPPEPTACPETAAAATDMPCLPEGTVCAYPGERSCVCMVPFDVAAHPCRIPSGPDGPLVRFWYCGGPGTGCSDGIHALGSPCTEEGAACGNPCANEYARVCRGGLWEQRLPETECL